MKTCPRCGACAEDGGARFSYDGEALVEVFAGSRTLGGRYLLEQRVAEGAMGACTGRSTCRWGRPSPSS